MSGKRPAGEADAAASKRSRTDAPVAKFTCRKKLKISVVCSSNMNRSMEAHLFLAKKGFNVKSHGTGSQVKIPGPAVDKPNCYEFGKFTYDEIYKDLETKDREMYTNNGMLNMVDRNRGIKLRPEKFQDEKEEFDIVVTCEARVFDQVNENFEEREQSTNRSVHVVNVEIKDNHESATLGALKIVDLCEKLEEIEDLDDGIEDAIGEFEGANDTEILHSPAFY